MNTERNFQRVAVAGLRGFLVCLFLLIFGCPASAEPLKIPSSVFILAQSLDLHSTSYALARGGREGNPTMQGSDAKRIALKGAATLGVVYLAHELDVRGKRKTARALLYSAAAFTSAVAARNYQIGRTP